MNFKPKLVLREQFQIPAPFACWCHLCDQGFMSIADMQRHDNDKVMRRKHEDIYTKKTSGTSAVASCL